MNSKEEIIEAAIKVFAEKGKYGARQEEIAEKTGFNKAMLYYYFSTKDGLFNEALYKVQKNIYEEIEKNLTIILASPESPKIKMRQFIQTHFNAFSKNQHYTKLYLQALASEPDEFKKTFSRVIASSKHQMINALPIFEEGKSTQLFGSIDFTQTMISIISLNLFYFMAKPIAEVILNINVENETEFLSERLESIISLLMHGITKA